MRQALFLAALLALAVPGPAAAQDAAGKQFRANCLNCHQPPDPTFTTDRAWLDQIHRTA